MNKLLGDDMSQGIILKTGHPQTPVLGSELVYNGTVTCGVCGKQFNIYHHFAHPEDDVKQSEWLQARLAEGDTNRNEHPDSFHYPR
jgi:hypothetical protein